MWISSLPQSTLKFLNYIKGDKPGFYHYSYSGDYLPEFLHWGLGNSVFALKIMYTLGQFETNKSKAQIIQYIKTFETEGYYTDPYIQLLSTPLRFLSSAKNRRIEYLSYKQTKRAETRQSINALNLTGEQVNYPSEDIPKTATCVEQFIDGLNWQQPWNAGSHFSHLIFMLKNSQLPERNQLIQCAINHLNRYQQPDGSWYYQSTSLQQKVNGAMKVITGLKIADETIPLHAPKKLVDTCLAASNDDHACDNFNIIYVLKNASKQLNHNYRFKEIQQFAENRLSIYQNYYYPDLGGFSFLPHQANRIYYGAPITKGRAEPDIHGTLMFLWGISLIQQLIKLPIQLNEHQP